MNGIDIPGIPAPPVPGSDVPGHPAPPLGLLVRKSVVKAGVGGDGANLD